jgi:hypothetical protein
MEAHFIKQYNSYVHFENSNGYNMTLGGDGTVGIKLSTSQIEERRKRMIEMYKNFTPEQKEKRSKNCSLGQKKRFVNGEPEVTKQRKKEAHQGKYLIVSPDGTEYYAENGLKEFAETTTLDVNYWQLVYSYRKEYTSKKFVRDRIDANRWKVIRLDKPPKDDNA